MSRTGSANARIEIVVNGQPSTAESGASVASWLAEIDRDPRVVAIERNGEIVPRARFAETSLAAGDRLEIVQFVQGG